MQNFDIELKSEPSKSYRVARIMADFDVKAEHCKEIIKGHIDVDISDDWNIGVIVGPSGTGKTTIAKNFFQKFYFGIFAMRVKV